MQLVNRRLSLNDLASLNWIQHIIQLIPIYVCPYFHSLSLFIALEYAAPIVKYINTDKRPDP